MRKFVVGLVLGAVLLIVGAEVVLASTSAGPSPAARVTIVRVAVTASPDSAPLFLGLREGFFSSEGLDVRPVPAGSSATAIKSVVGRKAQFGVATALSVLSAHAQGRPVRIVANASSFAPRLSGVLVRAASPLTAPGDLEGKRVAVPALGSLGELTVRAWIDEAFVDSSGVTFVALAPSAMLSALRSGRVDAANVPQPFLAVGLKSGFRLLGDSGRVLGPKATTGVWFMSAAYLRRHAGVVQRFDRALKRSQAYARNHTGELRRVLPTAAKVTQRVAKTIPLPRYASALDLESLEFLAELILDYDLAERKPDVAGMVWKKALIAKR